MRLLIVEDDWDGRELLAELFRRADWAVTAVATIDSAMTELRAGGFDVVITDENLAGRSGCSMLRAAEVEGLLGRVGRLVYTANSGRLEVPPGTRVLQKPVAVRVLLGAASAAVTAARLEGTLPTSTNGSRGDANLRP